MLKRGSESKGAAAAAGAAAIICGWIFFALLWGMVEPWIAFNETSCEILDRRVGLKSDTTTSRRSTSLRGSTTGSTTKTTVEGIPLVAVRFTADGRERIRVGFGTGMEWRPTSDINLVQLGETVPCWHDPEDQSRFTVARTPGIRGIAGLTVLVLVTLGLFLSALPSREAKQQPTGRGENDRS